MRTRTLLSPSPSINQRVLQQCKILCASETLNKTEEAQRKRTGVTRKTKFERTSLSNSETNRRLLELLVNAWVKGERLTDIEIRKRWNLTNMDPENSDMRKRKQQLRRALETYYLGTQYVAAEGEEDSIEIGLGHGFKIDVWSRKAIPQQISDVLATYLHVPANDIGERIDSADSGTLIRVCLTGFVDMVRWRDRLIRALKRTVPMEFLFPHPNSPFVEQRAAACKIDIKSILVPNRETLLKFISTAESQLEEEHQPLTKRGKLTLRWTNGWIPLPYLQIGNAIYVGAFWRDEPVGHGPFFLLDASSPTGDFLIQQFGKVWETAREDSLLEPGMPAMKESLLTSIR